MAIFNFKPKQVTKRLLAILPDRSRDVLVNRYGLGEDSAKMTLEAIGELYGITRERVRQIENHALQTIRKSSMFEKEQMVFENLENFFDTFGNVITEDDLLSAVAKDMGTQNHTYILLTLANQFTRKKEDAEFRHRWFTDQKRSDAIQQALRQVVKELTVRDLIQEGDMITLFEKNLDGIDAEHRSEENTLRWLNLSKAIGRNSLGEWGMVSSPNIRVKGMRDLAYLSIRRHGSPMHFTEVAEHINKLFGKEAHVATCHNELIKDERFVLVGRGLYALAEWGYVGGVVRDVIRDVLKKHGPQTRKEVVDKVLKERYVKENTVIVNLENPIYFKKDAEGRYATV